MPREVREVAEAGPVRPEGPAPQIARIPKVPKVRQAADYFDARAGSYHESSQRGAWRWLRRFEESAVLDLMGEQARGRVLELGCGAGYYSRLLLDAWPAEPAELVCSDLAPNMLEQLRGRACERILADMQELVLDREFDCILAAGSLEFVEQPERVFANARKMLAPGGVFVGLVPARSGFGWVYSLFHRANGLRIRLFDRRAVAQLAEDAGLVAVETRRCGLFSLAFKLRSC